MTAHSGLAKSRESLLALLADTSRQVDILSPQLESALLDNDALCEQLTRLARRGRHTRIRVLITEIKPIIETGHRLIALARRLKTAMEVRTLEFHPQWNGETVVLLDRSRGLVLKARDRQSRVIDSRTDARRLAEQFDRLWLASHPTPELRHL